MHRLSTVQSLPEKMRVLRPPGTRRFREPFFCAPNDDLRRSSKNMSPASLDATHDFLPNALREVISCAEPSPQLACPVRWMRFRGHVATRWTRRIVPTGRTYVSPGQRPGSLCECVSEAPSGASLTSDAMEREKGSELFIDGREASR